MKCPNKDCSDDLQVLDDGIICASCGFSALLETDPSSDEATEGQLDVLCERLKWLTYGLFFQAGMIALLVWSILE